MVTANQRLIRRLRRGDKEALARIYEEHKNRLLTLAYSLLGDRAAAEDCLQDVFLRLVRDAVNLRIRGNLSAYLSSCVLNRARDELRKSRRRVHVPMSDSQMGPSSGTVEYLLPENVGKEKRIQEALISLPAEQREVLALHLHSGLTFRRIAALQSVSINTAQSRYRYGIRKLRDLLVPKEE